MCQLCQTILSNRHKNSDLLIWTFLMLGVVVWWSGGLALGNIHCNGGQLSVYVLLSIWTELFPTSITREHTGETSKN